MWQVKNDVIMETTHAGNKIYQAKIGLLEDRYWRDSLKDFPIDLLCAIRKELEQSIPLLTEKFNPSNICYFGYKKKLNSSLVNILESDYNKDKAYIYIQKKHLRIDLDIDRTFEQELIKAGYEVKHLDNFQGTADWLTGWHVPHSTKDVKQVMKWLGMAFRRGGE